MASEETGDFRRAAPRSRIMTIPTEGDIDMMGDDPPPLPPPVPSPLSAPGYRDRGRQLLSPTSSSLSINDTERNNELRHAVNRVLQIVNLDDARTPQTTRHANADNEEVLDNSLPGPSSSSSCHGGTQSSKLTISMTLLFCN